MATRDDAFWKEIEKLTADVSGKRLADVFRFISFTPGETYGPHSHVRIEINYVKKGSCMIHLGHESVMFKKGEMMIIGSNVDHLFEAGPEGATLLQLEFQPDVVGHFDLQSMEAKIMNQVDLYSERNRLLKIVNNVPLMQTVQNIVNELRQKKPYHSYLVMMYYAELMILIMRYLNENYLPLSTNEKLKKAIDYIRNNYQHELEIGDVAKRVDLSPRYLHKLFVKYLNISPIEYLKQIRINHAIELLRHTNASIKEVCYNCGFNSQQYFSRLFKQQTGISPKDIVK